MLPNLFWLIKGIIIGCGISMPVGPLGVLCIQRTLKKGWIAGLLTGFGAATADMSYALLAAFGIGYVSEILTIYGSAMRIVGGIFLLLLGARTIWTADTSQQKTEAGKGSLYGLYSSAFFLTFTNPITIFGFTAIFASLGVGDPEVTRLEASQLVAGVFFGSALWYFSLSTIVTVARGKVQQYLPWINRIAGFILVAFGLLALLDGLHVIKLPI